MNLDEKIEVALAVLRRVLGEYRRPCVLWSGGKDSMVLLHLLRTRLGVTPPVVCFREPWLVEKQAFANRMIAEWGLEVWDWLPAEVSLCKGNGRIDVLNLYQFGTTPFTLARGTEAPVEGERWLCGRETFLARPLMQGAMRVPWDLALHGHKSSDEDPTSGAIPLEVDLIDSPGAVAFGYPLRYWTDEDVFAYIEREGVPYDETRYQRTAAGWEILKEKARNPDYYATCLRCMDAEEGEFVTCPKSGFKINNISESVLWRSPKMSYCNLRTQEEREDNGI